MELLRQGLRMTIYGSGDHSGDIWAVRNNAADSLDGAAWVSTAGQGHLAAIAVEGDTPPGGAHVA
jgi:hypothetical protein